MRYINLRLTYLLTLLLSLNIHVEKYCTNLNNCLLSYFTTSNAVVELPLFIHFLV